MIEKWIRCISFPNYEVSNYGKVRNRKTLRVLAPGTNSHGYLMVAPVLNGRNKTVTVHKLVATAFLEREEGLIVNHIDGDKKNNDVRNLEWTTYGANNLHAYRTGLKLTKKVQIVETGEIFSGAQVCAENIRGQVKLISRALRDPWRTHKGYHFEWV